MKLSVHSLKKTHFEGDITQLTCNTTMGQITVLDHHLPLITMLEEGVMKIIDTTHKDHYVPVKSGFIEVRDKNDVRCIIEEQQS